MIRGKQKAQTRKAGLHFITPLTKPQIELFIKEKVLQMDLFEENDCEVLAETGQSYILRRNPVRKEELGGLPPEQAPSLGSGRAKGQRLFGSAQTRHANDAIMVASQLLIPVVKILSVELLAGNYIQANETTVPFQTQEKVGKNHRAYIWQFSQTGGLVVFDFQMGRTR